MNGLAQAKPTGKAECSKMHIAGVMNTVNIHPEYAPAREPTCLKVWEPTWTRQGVVCAKGMWLAVG